MPKCPHCQQEVKETDKFCIFCGKPLIVSINNKKSESNTSPPKNHEDDLKQDNGKTGLKNEDSSKMKNKFIPFASGNLEPPEFSSKEENKKSKKESEDENKKFVPFTSENFDTGEKKLELDENIKEQLEMKIELTLLDNKKIKLKAKLDQIMKDVESEKYQMDVDFAKEVNAKLNAVKEIQKELKNKEEELKSKLTSFKIDELNNIIEERRAQLTELKRQYKFGKIQESIFLQLKQEYAQDYRQAQQELEKIQTQIKIWISKLKSELNKNQVKLKTIEARFKAKEIDKDRYESEKKDILNEIDIIEIKIKTLEQYTESKPKFL